jgi:hypothetical protein
MTPAPVLVDFEDVEHGARNIFLMGPGDDHAIRFERRGAFAVDVLVGEDVVVDILLLEPVEDVGIVDIVERISPRPHVGNGARRGGITGAASVVVRVVAGEGEFAMLAEIGVIGAQRHQAFAVYFKA